MTGLKRYFTFGNDKQKGKLYKKANGNHCNKEAEQKKKRESTSKSKPLRIPLKSSILHSSEGIFNQIAQSAHLGANKHLNALAPLMALTFMRKKRPAADLDWE